MTINLKKYRLVLICCILFFTMVCIACYIGSINADVAIRVQTEEPPLKPMQKLNNDFSGLQQIYMINGQTGWALTVNNELLYTDSGIDNFQTVKKIQSIDNYAHIYVMNDTTVYLVYFDRENIIVEYSQNTGSEWRQTKIPYRKYGDVGTVFIHFSDEQSGYLLSCSTPGLGQMTKILYKTSDGGENYEMISDLTNEISGYPTGLAYSDVNCGYISTTYHGEDKYLFYTSNGGMTWNNAELKEYEMQDVSYVEAYPPIFFGEENREGKMVLKYVGIDKNQYVEYVTQDSGATWKINSLLDCDSLLSYTYFDEGGYWIDGEGNVLISQ